MRMIIFLLCTTVFSLAPKTSFSQEKVIIDQDQLVSVYEIFNIIQQQTNYHFIFPKRLFQNSPSIMLEKGEILVVNLLEKALQNSNLKFEVDENNTILIKKTEPKPKRRQEKVTVSGKITDASGLGLPGVTVLEKGTSNGVATDFSGNYSIKTVNDAIIEFSYVGFQTQALVISDLTYYSDVNITLKEDTNALEEVIVTGYQSISKERATGAYEKVSKEQLEKPATNIGSRLIGSVAGLQSFVDENGDPRFQVRGQSSLNANQEPLVVVDGFPIQGGLNSINPNDVESVTILKDAAAASIWGARSSNGVIVITTKKVTKESPLKVEFSTFTRVGKKLNLDYVNPLASSSETIDYEIESYNKWRAPIPSPANLNFYFFSWSQLATTLFENSLGNITDTERDATIARLRNFSNKGQIRDELLHTPLSKQYNLSLSGSSKNMSNALSLLCEDNQTNFEGIYNKEYMLNYKTTANVFKWLDFNASAMLQKNMSTSNGVSLSDIQSLSPYDMLRDENGNLTNISTNYYWPIIERMVPTELFPYQDWTYNPIQEINNRNITNETNNIRLQGGLKFKIVPGLDIDTRLQYESISSSVQGVFNENTFFVRNAVNLSSSWNRATNTITPNLPKGGILSKSGGKTEIFNFRAQLNFNRSFGVKHRINFIGGSEIIDSQTNSFSDPIRYGYDEKSLRTGLLPNGFTGTRNWLNASQNFSYSPSFRQSADRFFSVYSNLEYTFDDKYTLSGSYRTDASNLITDRPEFRYDPFWSVGLSWQLKKEGFLNSVTWIDRLTLRGTFGYNGNIDKSTSFKPLISVSSSPNIYTGDFTAAISSFGNPSLRWEKTGTYNFGLDYSIFNGGLYGSLDIYKKEGKDLIASITIPAVNGTNSQRFNNAAMVNQGVEISLGTFQKIKGNDITWRGNLNFSYNKNKIIDLYITNYFAANLVNGGSGAYVEGENAQSLWTFVYGGLDEDGKPTHLGPDGTQYNFNVSALPGDDLDYVANKGTLIAPYILGFSSAFDIYDFNLSFIVTGKFGHVFKRQSFNYLGLFTSRVLPNKRLSEVRNSDPSEIIPLPTSDEEPTYFLWDRYYQHMDYLAESASHLRMQEINLTYNLPVNKIFKSSARAQIFVQGNNLFTIKSNSYGEDPEYALGTIRPEPTITFGTKWTF